MDEQWRAVVGYEGLYEVSDQGRVKSVARLVASKGGSQRGVRERIRRPAIVNTYPCVNLSRGGRTCMRSVHTMVLEAFRGPRPSATSEGCHADDVPTNNVLDNLRWDTKAANKADSIRHGRGATGARGGAAKLSEEAARAILHDSRPAAVVAPEYGVTPSAINRVRSGATWKALTAAQSCPTLTPLAPP